MTRTLHRERIDYWRKLFRQIGSAVAKDPTESSVKALLLVDQRLDALSAADSSPVSDTSKLEKYRVVG